MRRRSPNGLPELAHLELTIHGDRSASLEALLKEVAEQNRNGALQLFYSIRSVASRFNVPPATVFRIYRRLSAERILRIIWGSKTLLEPRTVCGNGQSYAIGIPVELSRFMESPDYRTSILLLQSELWNHGIDEHLMFFEKHDDEMVNLCTRNHRLHVDSVVWPFPEASSKPTILRLRDLGFRVFCLTDQTIPGMRDCYAVSDRCPIRTIIRKQILKI